MRQLTRADALIIGAICGSLTASWRGLALIDVIHNADAYNHSGLTFDEVSFGLPRLMEAGYVRVTVRADGTLRFRPTRMAVGLSLRAWSSRRQHGGYVASLGHAVGAPPDPMPEDEDRSLGRLPRLSLKEYERVCEVYSRSMEALMENSMISKLAELIWRRRPPK